MCPKRKIMKNSFKFLSAVVLTSFLLSCNTEGKSRNPTSDPVLESISLSGDYRINFTQNETFSYDGLVVTANYDDATSKVVEDYQVSTPDMSQLGEQDVTVTYLTVSEEYTIIISEAEPQKYITGIELSGLYQTSFTVGEEFNYNRLIVKVIYNTGEKETVTPTSVSTPDMSTPGDKEVTVTYLEFNASYTINVMEEIEDFDGYMYLAFYQKDIKLDDGDRYYLNPGVKDSDGNDVDVSEFPFSFTTDNPDLIDISHAGGIKSKKASTGTATVTCTYTRKQSITAKCIVNIVNTVKEKAWNLVNDYDSLKDGDILVIAAPTHGETASLDTLHSKLNTVNSTFNKDKSRITSLGEGTAEFYLGIETDKFGDTVMTLEAQNNQYLVCTHEGKVKLDASSNMNKYWDIHSNVDPETGEGDIADGAVIENNLASLGYLMFNVSLHYFTTYVDNSLRPDIMELPFLYRLEEIN